MAKRRPSAAKPTKEQPASPAIELATATLEFPLGDLVEGYELQQASAGRLKIDKRFSPEGAKTLIRLKSALVAQEATLQDGRKVASLTDALAWLLEQLAASAAE